MLPNANHNLPSPDARPDHNVGELQEVEDVFLLCVRAVLLDILYCHLIITQSVMIYLHLLQPVPLQPDVVLAAAAAGHDQATHLIACNCKLSA